MFKNLTEKQCYEYLGYGVAVFFVAYVASEVCKGQAKIMEGLVTRGNLKDGEIVLPEHNNQELVQRNEQLRHELYLSDDEKKYKKDYEDIILNLEEWADLETIKIITDQKCCKGDLNKNEKVVKQVNDLKTFKDSIEKTMTYLDRN